MLLIIWFKNTKTVPLKWQKCGTRSPGKSKTGSEDALHPVEEVLSSTGDESRAHAAEALAEREGEDYTTPTAIVHALPPN